MLQVQLEDTDQLQHAINLWRQSRQIRILKNATWISVDFADYRLLNLWQHGSTPQFVEAMFASFMKTKKLFALTLVCQALTSARSAWTYIFTPIYVASTLISKVLHFQIIYSFYLTVF